jgi:hypothetical protein
MKPNKFCQSCRIPIAKNPELGGSEKDGAKSKLYCSYCYKDGEFMMADEADTAEKMQKLCIKMMKKQGMNGLLAWVLTRNIPPIRTVEKVESKNVKFEVLRQTQEQFELRSKPTFNFTNSIVF